MTEDLTMLQSLIYVKRAEEGLKQISAIFRLQFSFGTGIESVLSHAQIVTDNCLRPVVNQRTPQQRQVTFVMLRKEFVEVLGSNQL